MVLVNLHGRRRGSGHEMCVTANWVRVDLANLVRWNTLTSIGNSKENHFKLVLGLHMRESCFELARFHIVSDAIVF